MYTCKPISKLPRIAALIAVLTATSGFLSGWSSSEPELWEGWEIHNPGNTKPIDHSAWNGILKTYLRRGDDGLARFAYAKVSAKDHRTLKTYIAKLGDIRITDRSRKVQLAYWINLYNALTIDVVLDHYPVKSIRDIDISGVLADGPWGRELITIEGNKVSLDNIEHEILRPIWKDPRIHYAVNCASVGCPNLAPEAYTAKEIDKQLDKAARDFVNDPRGLTIKDDEVTVSKIYSWFAYDFGNSEAGIIKHLKAYATPERAATLSKIGRISHTKYDWSLNE